MRVQVSPRAEIFTQLVDNIDNIVVSAPLWFPSLLALCLITFLLPTLSTSLYDHPVTSRLTSGFCILGLVGVAFLLGDGSTTGDIYIFNNILVIDSLGRIAVNIIIFAGICTLLISGWYLRKGDIPYFDNGLLFLLVLSGVSLLAVSQNLIALYLALELQSLSIYVLASSRRVSEHATEAGLKYFVLGAFSSGLFLFGSALLYAGTGTLSFETFLHVNEALSAQCGAILLVSGLLFKLALAPFHIWAPDVYEGAPTAITTLFALVPKIAILVVFSRILSCLPLEQVTSLLVGCAAISVVVGTIGAILQTRIKRFLAFSAVAHSGYLFFGLCSFSIEGTQSFVIYIILYVLIGVGTFGVLIGAQRGGLSTSGVISNDGSFPAVNGRSDELAHAWEREQPVHISDVRQVGSTHTFLCFLASLTMFSLAGIPPLAGFFGKLYIFLAAIKAQLFVAVWLGILTSVISCFYYIRIVKVLYFDTGNWWFWESHLREIGVLFAFVSFILVAFFLAPQGALELAYSAAL